MLSGCWQSEDKIYEVEDYFVPVQGDLVTVSDTHGPLGLYSISDQNQYVPVYTEAETNSLEQTFRSFNVGFVPIDRMATYKEPHEDWQTNPTLSRSIFEDEETRLFIATLEHDEQTGQVVVASFVREDVLGICPMVLQKGKSLHEEFLQFASMREPAQSFTRKAGIAVLALNEVSQAKQQDELSCNEYKIEVHQSRDRARLIESVKKGDALRKAESEREAEAMLAEVDRAAEPYIARKKSEQASSPSSPVDISAQVTASPQALEDPQLDWIKGLIGSWRFTSSTGSDIVALIWPLEYPGRPSRYLAFAASTADGQCIYEIATMATPSIRNERDRRWGFTRAAEGTVHTESFLNVRFATNVVGANGRVSNDIPYPVRRACLERLKASGYFVYDLETRSFSYARDDFESTNALVRTAPTPALNTYLAHEERRYTQRRDDLRVLPDAQLRRLFTDPSLTYASIVPQRGPLCRFRAAYSFYRLQALGVRQVSAFRLDDDTVDVTLEYWRRDDAGWVSETLQYRDQGEVDWDQLNLKGYDLDPSETTCKAAQAALQYVAAAEAGRLVELGGAGATTYEKIDDITQTFIVDRSGVDEVASGKIDTGAGLHSRHYATRFFGRTNSFVKGDITREFDWEPASQSMQLFGYVKADSFEATATRDDLGLFNRVRFRYDAQMSERLGAPVFKSGPLIRSSETCLIWEEEYRKSKCVQQAPAGETLPVTYVTTSQTAATVLFKELSPDEETWTDGLPKSYCPGEPLCDVTFGDYFNAIYRDDAEAIRRLGRVYTSADADIAEDLIPDERWRTLLGVNRQQLSPVYLVINAYMHNYKDNPRACFKPGAVRMEFSDYIPGTETRTITGILLDSTSGIPLYAEYVINQEFEPVCEDICTADGPREMSSFMNQLFGSGNVALFERGLREINANYGCNSEVLKTFERNLIKLYYTKKNPSKPLIYRNTF